MKQPTHPQTTASGDSLKAGKYILHSRFTEVVNFVCDNNLLVLAKDIKYLSPNTLIVENVNIKQINEVILENNQIKILPENINLKIKNTISSEFNFELANIEKTNYILSKLQNKYLPLFPAKSLAFLLDNNRKKHFQTAFERAFYQQITEGASLINNNQILEGIKNIKGRGLGLTPSGDDFVAGVLFALHFKEHLYNKDLSKLRNNILEIALSKNIFSNNFLIFAHDAKFFYRFKNFLEKAYNNPDNLEQPLNQLFEIGSTSGADLLTGFILTIQYKL